MSRGPVIPAFGRQTQEDGSKLEASLGDRSFQASQGFTVRSYVKTMRRGREGGGRVEGRCGSPCSTLRLRWGVCVRNPGQHEVCSETLKNKNTGCGVVRLLKIKTKAVESAQNRRSKVWVPTTQIKVMLVWLPTYKPSPAASRGSLEEAG